MNKWCERCGKYHDSEPIDVNKIIADHAMDIAKDIDNQVLRDIGMKTYKTYEHVADMKPCMKRPITVHAIPIHEPFRVNTLEGDYKQGKPGDYLMKGIDGELYICDKDIFERTYDFV